MKSVTINIMKQAKGFTVIELLVLLAFIIGAGVLFFVEKNQIEQTRRDTQRKVSINAMYYALEEVYHPQNGHYPSTIDSKVLRSVDPSMFQDPNDVKIGTEGSDFRYEPTGCTTDNKCTSYTLKSTMEREAEYIKVSRN